MRFLGTIAFVAIAGALQAQQPFALDTSFRTTINQEFINSVAPLANGNLLLSGMMKFPGDSFFRGCVSVTSTGERITTFPDAAPGGGRITPWNDLFYVNIAGLVERIHSDGTLDTSFHFMYNDPHFIAGQGGDYYAYPDGRVLLTGNHGVFDAANGFYGQYSLVWFSNTGHYDTTRAPRATDGGVIYRIAPLENGQFYCGGGFTQYEGDPVVGLVRIQPDGAYDPSFQTSITWGAAITLRPLADGRVLVAGLMTFQGSSDTLRLVRFMPDGSLDPTFNNHLDPERDFTNNPSFLISSILQVDPDRFILTGGFNLIDGEPHGHIAMIDSTGHLVDGIFQGTGAGTYLYQNYDETSINGIMPTGDGTDDYWIWGSYHGYDDGTTNDTLQRMVSRLHGLTVGIQEQPKPAPAGSLVIRPNPASTWVVFEYRLVEQVDQAYIRVTGIDGRELTRIPINAAEGQPVFDTRQVAKGAYTVELVNGGKTIEGGKLIVQ